MSESFLFSKLSDIEASQNGKDIEKSQLVEAIISHIDESPYDMEDYDDSRPWGAFFKLKNDNSQKFIEEFFPSMSLSEVSLGLEKVELSPKILLISPDQRLSWQYHNRRAEIWSFLTEGAYHRSFNDDMGDMCRAKAGETVQLAPNERHRLVGRTAMYTIVAEIWQHIYPEDLSCEDDNIRLQDDYGRNKK